MTDLSALVETPTTTLTPTSLGGLEISTVDETSDSFNLLIYGDSGVGKTRLAGTVASVPEMMPALFLDVEGGIISLKHLFPNLHTIRVTDFRQLQKVYDALHEGKSEYKTVVIDSLSEVQKFGMYDIMERAVQKEPGRDPDLAGIGEWGKNTEQMRKFARAWRDLPNINVVLTALRNDNRNPKTGVTTTMPGLTDKAAREVCAIFDEVLYYYVKKNPDGDDYLRLLLTQKTEEIIAKDRSDNLPPIMIGPTMSELYDYITHKRSRDQTNMTQQETPE